MLAKSLTLHGVFAMTLVAISLAAPTSATESAGTAPYSAEVAAELMAVEPIKVGTADHPAVAPSVRLAARGKLGAACQDADRRFRGLQAEGAQLFFGPDRRKAELTNIERFLDRHVRAKAPALEIIDEAFAPGPTWRTVAAVACVQSGQPAIAVRLLAAMASHAPASRSAGRFAVALAAQERDWQKGLAAADHNQTLPVVLLRALAEPAAADSALMLGPKLASSDRDRAAIAAVRRHLGRAP